MKQFRHNKRKRKKGCGCKLCKAHKGIWSHFFNAKNKAKSIACNEQMKEIK